MVVIACYEVQLFMAIALSSDNAPDSDVVNYAIVGGLGVLLGYFFKSGWQKASLNKNGLKINASGDVTNIDSEKEDSNETPTEE